ncbi:MAG: hypothetical protein ABI813_04915 [Bacteroidota bacterium]
MRPDKYRIYLVSVIIILLLALISSLYVLLSEYDSLIAGITATIHKNGLEEKIRTSLFTRQRFVWAKRLASLVIILLPLGCWLALRFRSFITARFRVLFISVWQSVKSSVAVFQNNSRRQNKAVAALMTIIILFYSYHMISGYLRYDEMWSFNYYTDHPFYYSFFTFSNYPLFEATTHFFKWLPTPMKINLRLSPFFAGISSCFLLYACLRKYYNSHFVAMAGVIALAFAPLTAIFMVNARGVMHELFFAIAGIFSFLFWMERPDRKRYLVVYFVAAVAGVYSMITHFLLLFLLLVAGLWVLKNKKRPAIALFLKINLLIIVVCLLCYAPMMFTTGIAVFEDIISTTPSYYHILIALPDTMQSVFMAYTGRSYISVVLFLVAIAILPLLKNKLASRWHLMIFLIVGLPVSGVFLYLVTRFLFTGRSLAFGSLAIPLLVSLFAAAAAALPAWNKKWQNSIGCIAVVVLLLADGYFYLPAIAVDKQSAAISRLLIENGVTTCYDNSSMNSGFFYYYPGIEYYYRISHKSIELTLSAKNSMRYKPLLARDRYDCIVYNSSTPESVRPQNFHEIYQDSFGKFEIWKRNDLQ